MIKSGLSVELLMTERHEMTGQRGASRTKQKSNQKDRITLKTGHKADGTALPEESKL